MYRDYAIMQEASSRARDEAIRRGRIATYVRPRRVAVVNASGQVEALGNFEYERYLVTGNRQYAGGKFQWRSARSFDSEWRDWDGVSDPGTKGREWRLVVTLRNGRVEHDAYFMAWPQSR
jgi:hypothetical protein